MPWLHVIHQPDLPGVACDLRQHDFKTPTYILQHFSNFPNFRLFDEPGSPCDTLGVDGYVAVDEIENGQDEVYVFPNPLRRGDQCYVKSTARWYRAEFWSVDGRLIEVQDLDFGIGLHGLPVSAGLSAGVYVLKLLGPNGVSVAKKLLVME